MKFAFSVLVPVFSLQMFELDFGSFILGFFFTTHLNYELCVGQHYPRSEIKKKKAEF